MLRAKTGEINERLPADLLVEGEHLWFEWETESGKLLPCCRWCGIVMPRDPMLQQRPCRGVVRIKLRPFDTA